MNEWETPYNEEFIIDEFPYSIVRNGSGVLCGYVGLDKEHSFYKVEYSELYHLRVHGSLTFSDFRTSKNPEFNNKWWLGFDCGHLTDYVPYPLGRNNSDIGLAKSISGNPNNYRNVEYVKKEIKKLIQQLKYHLL